MVGPWPALPPGATSGLVALQQQVSVTTKSQADVSGLGCAELAPTLAWATWESWFWGHESQRADPPLANCSTQESRALHIP